MCNNNCCTCCQCGTHDDDTPQEITYTSVCNSDVCKDKDGCRCCCCKNKGVCEDDPNIRLDGMEERMEECCEEVNERITNLECELEKEKSRSIGEDLKHDDEIEDLYNKESLDYNNVDYTLDNHNLVVNFYHDDVFQDSITIPVESFIKDWFVDDVDLIDSHILRITFNVDPTTETHHEPRIIDIDLNDFLNPGNYYTKTQIDNMINPLSQSITNLTTNLNNYKTEVSNTYETKVAAGNHYKEAIISGRRITLTKENGNTTPLDLPEDLLVKQNNCVDDAAIPVLLAYSSNPTSGTSAQAYYSGVTINPHTTVINGIADKAIKDDDGNNISDTYVSSGSFNNSNRNLTLVNPAGVTLATINIPDADTNKYVVSGAVNNNNQLTLTYNDGTTTQPIDLSGLVVTDHYVTSGTVTNGVLKLTRQGVSGTVDIQLPAGADGDHYPDTMSFNSTTGKLTLSGTNSTFSTLETTIPIPAADNTNPITDVLQNGDTVTFTYKDNTSESITVGGNTNVTYGGNTVTLQQAITSIENRLNALEGLWEINPNDSTQVVAKNNRSAKAAGFYDSTVNTV